MMKRLTTGLLVVLATMALTTSALAQSSVDKGKPPRPTTTTTTLPAEPLVACENALEATAVAPGTIELTIAGSGQVAFECLWTPQNLGIDHATVTVKSISGPVRGLPQAFVRDDSPGDICLLESEWLNPDGVTPSDPPYYATFDLAYAAGLPAGYEAWENTTYWTFTYQDEPTGTHWCAPQDPVLDSVRYDTNGGALHFQLNFSARGGKTPGTVVVELSP